MNVKNIEREGTKAKITVELEKELMNKGADAAYKKACKDIQLPGFRKGKAPRKLIEKYYGAHVFYEDGLEEIFPEIYEFAVVKQELKAVGAPSVTKMDIAEDGSATIVVETDLYPEVTLGQYKGLEIEKAEAVVTDNQVEAELEQKAKTVARTETLERAAEMGDTANIDFEGFKDGVAFDGGKGENFDLVLGSGSFIPGFEEKIVGMNAGEERDLDLTFPEDYHAEELAGAAVVFHVTLNKLTRQILPTMDDEFAKDVSEFDTLAELKESIRKEQLEQREKSIQAAFENAAVEQAADNTTVELPQSMVEEMLDRQMENFGRQLQASGMTMEQYAQMMGGDVTAMRNAFRAGAEKQVRVDVTLAEIVKAENVEATEEEVEAEYQTLADAYKMEVEKVKKFVTAEDLKQDLLIQKAAKIITESAVAVAPKAAEKTETEE